MSLWLVEEDTGVGVTVAGQGKACVVACVALAANVLVGCGPSGLSVVDVGCEDE